MASPATRRRAREAGIDLAQVHGRGPSGRITRQDLDAALTGAGRPRHCRRARRAAAARRASSARTGIEEIKVIGVRRVIAQAHDRSEAQHPALRLRRGSRRHRARVAAPAPQRAGCRRARAPLTYLPFLIAALVRVLERYPQCNALVRRRARRAGASPRACTRASPRRRRTASRCRSCAMPRRARCGTWPTRSPRLRCGAQRQGDQRGADRLDDHRDQPRQARWHRLDADHQRARDGHHRRQQGRSSAPWC